MSLNYTLNHSTLLLISAILFTILLATLYRLYTILTIPPAKRRPNSKSHLLVVLGSGGHTSEMLSILRTLGHEYLNKRFSHRTYIVTSGDNFSIERAREFEAQDPASDVRWSVNMVHRARKIHQPLYTTPISALRCFLDCLTLMGYDPPDIVFMNGAATAVVVGLPGLTLMMFGIGQIRTVYIESWARVKTLSLSGRILRWLVSRFLVQWKGLADVDSTVKDKMVRKRGILNAKEYIGPVVT